MRTSAPLLAPVFRSDGQARLLSVVLLAGEAMSLSELAARAGLAYATAHREVDRLLEAGILTEQRVGRTRLVSTNLDSPLAAPLREIILIVTGPVVLLSDELHRIAGIDAAFLYGSFAARMHGTVGQMAQDIDVMIIGSPDPDAVYRACDRVEAAVHRPVNPSILSRAEASVPSGFLERVRAEPVVPILGSPPWG